MATQYTSILKLALPTQGELSGTWGDVVNDNITSMVEEAIAGRSVINSWAANSHTLTTADGLTSESRAAMLEFTDTGTALSGAATVICPTATKIYVCKNGAGQTVTVKTAAGTGVAIPNGETMFVFCDGTNVVQAVTSLTTLKVGTGIQVSTILDEDNMASDSATALATQQSIKAYVDAQITAQDLDFAGDTGTGAVDLDSQTFTVAGTANEIETSASGQTITIGLPTAIVVTTITTTNVQATNIKANDGTAAITIADSTGQVTVTDAVLTTADINGGTADNVTIGGSTAAAGSFTTLGASGTTSLGGALALTGNLDINTNKFNVTAADGNTLIAGTLGVTGDVDLNGGTIDGTVIGGTTAAAGSFTTGQFNTSVNVDGTVTADGLTVDGNITVNAATASLFLNETDTTDENTQLVQASGTFRIRTADDAGSNVAERLRIDHGTGDISFYEDTGTTAKFFWDASTERLGIGNTSPATTLDVTGTVTADGLTVDGNSVFTTADNSAQVTLISTDTDALVGPQLNLWRNSGSAANGDLIGQITFTGEDSLSNTITYASIHGVADQVDNGAEDGSIRFSTRLNDVLAERLAITQLGGVTINDTGIDADFRVESDTNTHALFVQGSDGFVGINESNPLTLLHLKSSSAGEILRIESTEGGTSDGPILGLYRNSASPADGDGLGTINFYGEDSAGNTTTYGQIRAESSDVSNGTEDGLISLRTVVDGSVIARINLIPSEAVFNESGADLDFRVESSGNANALFIQGSDGNIGIGTGTSLDNKLEIAGGSVRVRGTTTPAVKFNNNDLETVAIRLNAGATGTLALRDNKVLIDSNGGFIVTPLAAGHAVFNENSVDADFRVESNDYTHALFVDAGANHVNINGSTDFGGALNVNGGLNSKQAVFTSTNNRGLALSTATRGGQNDGVAIIDAQDTESTGGRLELHTMGAVRASFERDQIIFNESGNDQDFRVESDSNAHALFVEGDNTNNRIKLGMGTGTITNPYGQDNFTDLNINGTWGGMISFKLGGTEKGFIGQRNSGNGDMIVGASSGQSLFLASNGNTSRIELTDAGEVVVNPTGADNDFRVQSDANANMLFVDAGNNAVGIGTNLANTPLTVVGGLGSTHSFMGFFSRETTNNTIDILTVTGQDSNSGTAIYARLVATAATTNNSAVIEFWAALHRAGGGANTATAVTPVIAKAIAGTAIGAGTLAWSGTTLQYTTSSSANYIGYSMEIQVTDRDGATISILP